MQHQNNWKETLAKAEEEYKTIFSNNNTNVTNTSTNVSIDNDIGDDGKSNLLLSELGYLTTKYDNKKKISVYRYPPQKIPNFPSQLTVESFTIPTKTKNIR